MMTTNAEDLFICGKCQANFNDLNCFLSHRSNCNGEKLLNLFSLSTTNPTTALLVDEIDSFIEGVDLSLPTTTTVIETTPTTDGNNLFYATSNTENGPPNDFDILFTTPVEQMTANVNENTSLEKEISQMSLLECPVCDEQFDAPTVLEHHVFEHSTWIDEDDKNNVQQPPTYEDSASSYIDLVDDSQKSPLECKQCTVTFTSNASLNIHKRMIHCLNPVFRCLNETCSQLFEKPVDYILHARIHSQKKHLGARRSSRPNVYHRRRKRTYRCRLCKKTFPTSDQLQYHVNYETHKFICQLCPAEFDSNNSYHNHIAKHVDPGLYRCTICIESFKKRNDLSRHVLTKHNDDLPKQKSCETCKLTFKTTFHLNRHNNTKHSNIKPFKCDQDGCQEAFARKDKLKQHAAKHSESGGTFKCQLCFKAFVRPEHLRDHEIVRHSRQYPFRCEYCSKGFLHQNQLYAHHKQRHTTENQNLRQDQQNHQDIESFIVDSNKTNDDLLNDLPEIFL